MTARIPPVIGISAYREEAAWGVWRQRADLLHVEYADWVSEVGGAPVLLPAAVGGTVAVDDRARAVVRRLDGLIIAGGADVDPARYGADPDPRTRGWQPPRDEWELALLTAAAGTGLPALGVCRGMQLMAVHAGGALEQHVPDRVGHAGHNPAPGEFGQVVVTTEPGSLARAILGERTTVPCHHHQAVAAHPGLRRTAEAGDGTPEAIEAEGERFWLGVQWHPEKGSDPALIRALVDAAYAGVLR